MKKIVSLLTVTALAAVVSLSAIAPSSAAPWHRHGYDPGLPLAAGVVGFMAGAMAASAASHDDAYYAPRFVGQPGWRDHRDACFRAYRSYDVASDTYLGYDGYRHYCEL